MAFTITIQETLTYKTTEKEWKVIDSEEVARDDQWRLSDTEPKTRIKDVYGYTPEREVRKNVDIKVYEQRVETLDMAAVIKAINGLQ